MSLSLMISHEPTFYNTILNYIVYSSLTDESQSQLQRQDISVPICKCWCIFTTLNSKYYVTFYKCILYFVIYCSNGKIQHFRKTTDMMRY